MFGIRAPTVLQSFKISHYLFRLTLCIPIFLYNILSSLGKQEKEMMNQIQSQEKILNQAIKKAERGEEGEEIQDGLLHLIRYNF